MRQRLRKTEANTLALNCVGTGQYRIRTYCTIFLKRNFWYFTFLFLFLQRTPIFQGVFWSLQMFFFFRQYISSVWIDIQLQLTVLQNQKVSFTSWNSEISKSYQLSSNIPHLAGASFHAKIPTMRARSPRVNLKWTKFPIPISIHIHHRKISKSLISIQNSWFVLGGLERVPYGSLCFAVSRTSAAS